MGRQHTLSLDGLEPVRAPWCEFPEEDRRRAVEILARLLARASGGETEKESSDDDDKD